MWRGARWALLLAALGIGQTLAQTPPPSQGNGSLSGRVLDGATGQPVAGADVILDAPQGTRGGAPPGRTTSTDAKGEFTFRDVAPGTRRVDATKEGYRRGYAGGMTASEQFQREPIQLSSGEQLSGVVVRLWRGASVAGHIRMASGTPLVRAKVYAMRVVASCGVERLSLSGPLVTTDDTGAYRFFDLAPDRYVIEVEGGAMSTVESVSRTQSGALPTTYAPGVVAPALAQAIALAAGDDRLDADVVIPAGGFSIHGRAVIGDPPGSAGVHRIELLSASQGPIATHPVARAFSDPDGRFVFPRVPPGSYVVRIVEFPPVPSAGISQTGGGGFSMKSSSQGLPLPPAPDAPTWWGQERIDIADRDADTTVGLREGWRIQGQVTFNAANGGPPAAQLESMPVLTFRSDGADLGGTMPAGRVETNGRFTTAALPPGRYVLSVLPAFPSPTPANTGLSLQAVRSGGRDVTGSSIEVNGTDVRDVTLVFTDRAPVVAGTVQATADLAPFGARYYVFPTDEAFWSECGFGSVRFSTGSVQPDGRFRARAVPPGEYFVAAAIGADDSWIRTDFLRSLVPFAQRVKLALGDTQTVTLKARPRQ